MDAKLRDDEVPLHGGWSTPGVVRIGKRVHRPILHDARFRHALLRFLEGIGFQGVPRFHGIDQQGREVLSFVEGDVPGLPYRFDDAKISAAAWLLRRFHDATAGCELAGNDEVVCHNDWVPANSIFRDGVPAGIFDFDAAAPGTRLWDLGRAAWGWLQFGEADYSGEEQRRRLAVFARGYGWPATAAQGIAVHALARQSAMAAWAKHRGRADRVAWACDCAAWTAVNVTEPLISHGQPWS